MKRTLVVVATLLVVLCGAAAPGQAQTKRPNVVIILGDDMGYSDISCFGGEIPTPNLDALADRGIRGTSFYVGPTCSPTSTRPASAR